MVGKKNTCMGIIGQVTFTVNIDIQKMYAMDKIDKTVEWVKN